MLHELSIQKLHVTAGDKEVVAGVSLTIKSGELHALLGPNGSGKSSLAACLAGHPSYLATVGSTMYDGEDILALAPEIRAQRGIFLAFQHPTSIPGLTISEFLRAAYSAVRAARKELEVAPDEFRNQLTSYFARVGLRPELLEREVNADLSGGEKKRLELVQLLVLNPTIAILDETDSGLDIDALKIVAAIVRERVEAGLGALVITHYQRLLDYLAPSQVHVMMNGKLVAKGGAELTQHIDEHGYESFNNK